MKYDIFNLTQKRDDGWSAKRVLNHAADQVRLADELGFETAWFAEHHLSNYCLIPSPLMACAYLAPITKTIRLGAAVVVAPLYNPLRLVQEIALVDQLSDGRLSLGLGAGYQDYEFDRFGVKLKDGVEMTVEMLDIIERALTADSFAYDGKHYKIPQTQIATKTVQQPLPDIWVAGLSGIESLQDRMVASGYCPMHSPAWMPIDVVKRPRAGYDDRLRKAGRDPDTARFGVQRFIYVTDDKAEARKAAEHARYSSRLSQSLTNNTYKFDGYYIREEVCDYEPPIEDCMKNYVIGSADHAIETLVKDWETVRPSNIICTLQLGGVPEEKVMRTLELLGSKIIPGVEKELAARGAKQPEAIVTRPQLAQAAE